MKEFQALGLDISIINDNGETLQLKEIEEAEDKDDNNTTMDELENTPVAELTSESDNDESFDDEYSEDEDDEFNEEYEDFMDGNFNGDEDFEEGADL